MRKLMIDPDTARDHIQSNWPNDPVLRTIGLNLVDTLPKEEVEKSRRSGCAYCRDGKTFKTHIDGEAEIVEMFPLPAINLTTGEMESTAKEPFFAVRTQSHENGEDFVPIEFCPKCGRDLKEDS